MNLRTRTLTLVLILLAAPLCGCSSTCPTGCRPSAAKSAGDLAEGAVAAVGIVILAPFYLLYMLIDGLTPETCVPCDPCEPCYPCDPCDPCPPRTYCEPPPRCYEPCPPAPRRYQERPGHGDRRGGGRSCG